MADISGLKLVAPDKVDYDHYQDGGEFQPPPPEGPYTLQAPESDKFKFDSNKEGKLVVVVDPLVISDNNAVGAGYKIGFTRISATKYKNREGTPIGDYLRANGLAISGEPNNQELADAVESTAGRIFPARTQWEAYCKECDFNLQGMDRFPKNEDGTRDYHGVCKHCKKEILARLKVRGFVSTVATEATA